MFDKARHTPFCVAVIKGFITIAELMLQDEMSDINFRDYEGDTPLHWAVLLDNAPMVQFLLDNGADISQSNNSGNNAVMIACINQRVEILRLLLNPLIRPKNNPQNRPVSLYEVQQ